jgi:hypothetical protein
MGLSALINKTTNVMENFPIGYHCDDESLQRNSCSEKNSKKTLQIWLKLLPGKRTLDIRSTSMVPLSGH